MSKYILLYLLFVISNCFSQNVNDLIPKNESFYIRSAQGYGQDNRSFWDVPGGEENIKKSVQIKIWELSDVARDRRYLMQYSPISGYLNITMEGIAANLDVAGGDNKNGAKLIIWEPNNTSAQNFIFKYLGSGRFKIYNQNGKVIALEGRSSDNGNAIVMWDDHEGPWTEWMLISTKTKQPLMLEKSLNDEKKKNDDEAVKNGFIVPPQGLFYIKSVKSALENKGYWDQPGLPNSYNAGDKISVYAKDCAIDQRFQFVPAGGGWYSIVSANNGYVDSRDYTKINGTRLIITEKNNASTQKFRINNLGEGRFKIYTYAGKVVCLENRNSENGSSVSVWDDHNGEWMEWYFEDVNTGKYFVTGFAGINNIQLKQPSTPELENLALEINKTFNRIEEVEKTGDKVSDDVRTSIATFDKIEYLSSKLDDLNSKVGETNDALGAFSKFPFIGTPVTALKTTLTLAASPLGKASNGLKAIKAISVVPSNNNLKFALPRIQAFQYQLFKAKIKLWSIKKDLSEDKKPLISINELNIKCKELFDIISPIESNLKEIASRCSNNKKLEEAVSKVYNGVEDFERVFNKTDKIADKINGVLDKRFKKQITKVKIDISVRDIVSGGKVGKIFDKYFNEWISNLLEPIIKDLNIKLPAIPSIDNLKEELAKAVGYTNAVKENSIVIENTTEKCKKSVNSF